MLDFRIQTFITVCKYMNYTRAAEELNMTQPAISQQIHFIEDYYNTKLFIYENRRLLLTTEGEKLRNSLQTMIHDDLRLREELSTNKEQKYYRIGASMSIGEYYLPPFLSKFMTKHPEVKLSVTVADTKALLEMLDGGLLDLALSEGYFNKDNYETRFIKNENLYVFAGKNYDASDIHKVTDLFHHPLMVREEGSGTREVLERFLTEKGYKMDSFSFCCDFSSPRLLSQMLLGNHGISLMYECVAKELVEEGRMQKIILEDINLSHEFNAIWQRGSLFGAEYELLLKELAL